MLMLTDEEELVLCAWCDRVLDDGARVIVEGRLTPHYGELYCERACLEARRSWTGVQDNQEG